MSVYTYFTLSIGTHIKRIVGGKWACIGLGGGSGIMSEIAFNSATRDALSVARVLPGGSKICLTMWEHVDGKCYTYNWWYTVPRGGCRLENNL